MSACASAVTGASPKNKLSENSADNRMMMRRITMGGVPKVLGSAPPTRATLWSTTAAD
jgi:uncharacterized protein YceK